LDKRDIDILLIEDNPDDQELLQSSLREAHPSNLNIVVAERLADAMELIQSRNFDVILLDISLPDSCGLDTFVKLHALASSIPIIILTGRNDEELADMALKEGAQDYIVKGNTDNALLFRSIRYAIERKNSELELRKSEELYRTVVTSLAEGILLINAKSTITACNLSAEKIFGIPTDSLMGKDFYQIFPKIIYEDYSSCLFDEFPVNITLREGKSFSGVVVGIFKPELIWIILNSRPIYRAGEASPFSAVVSFSDISKRKKMEEDLRQAKDAAESATRFKTEFLANISHEIRTPMNAILGMTELASRTKLDPVQSKYLKTIKISAESLLALINDILDLAKIEAGKLELEEIPFKPRVIIEEVVELLSVKAGKKKLELKSHVVPGVPLNLLGDPMKLRQVLINLVDNAIKFTRSGAVAVKLERNDDGQDVDRARVLFSVTDTGIGISEEELGRIFEPFVQADGSTTRNYGGTGLGLSISSQLVHQMGGEMLCESEVGVGTTFFFEVDFKIAPKETNQAVQTQRIDRKLIQDLIKAEGLRPQAKNDKDQPATVLKMLLADDNELNHFLITEILKGYDHDLRVVFNGAEAVDQFKKEAFDIIFMDIQMPIMDGIEASRRIRELEKETGEHTPIVAITARVMPDEMRECQAAGIDYFISKPLKINDFTEFIENFALSRKNGSAAIVPPPAPSMQQSNAALSLDTRQTFNETDFLARIGGNQELAAMMVEVYLEQLPAILASLEDALNSEDLAGIRLHAHTLKGESANVGGDAVSHIAAQIERAGKDGDLDVSFAMAEKLPPEIEKLVAALSQRQDRA